MRIVSLLPSATEMICLLGLEIQLVGVTHECDFPTSIVGRPIVTRSMIPADATSAQIDAFVRERAGGKAALYQLDVDVLSTLQPDLIVTQALCDVCAVDEAEVARAADKLILRPTVLNLEPMSLAGVFDSIASVATAAGVADRGAERIEALRRRVAAVVARVATDSHRPSVVFLEWLDPPFCAGHWNPQLVELAGGRECIGRAGERSRRIDWEEVANADPDILFVACCGFLAERTMQDIEQLRTRPEWQSLRAVRDDRVYVTDGSAYFNRPGPRLVDSLEILAGLIHSRRPLGNTSVPMLDSDGAMSREYLLARGTCCTNGCRNCPYKTDSATNPSIDSQTQKCCERCRAAFTCCGGTGWCGEIQISSATARSLQHFTDCLCLACLTELSQGT